MVRVIKKENEENPVSESSVRYLFMLSSWPVEKSRDYEIWLNKQDEDDEQLTNIRESLRKGRPYGNESWVMRMVDRFDLGSTVRNHGRPRKGT